MKHEPRIRNYLYVRQVRNYKKRISKEKVYPTGIPIKLRIKKLQSTYIEHSIALNYWHLFQIRELRGLFEVSGSPF